MNIFGLEIEMMLPEIVLLEPPVQNIPIRYVTTNMLKNMPSNLFNITLVKEYNFTVDVIFKFKDIEYKKTMPKNWWNSVNKFLDKNNWKL